MYQDNQMQANALPLSHHELFYLQSLLLAVVVFHHHWIYLLFAEHVLAYHLPVDQYLGPSSHHFLLQSLVVAVVVVGGQADIQGGLQLLPVVIGPEERKFVRVEGFVVGCGKARRYFKKVDEMVP